MISYKYIPKYVLMVSILLLYLPAVSEAMEVISVRIISLHPSMNEIEVLRLSSSGLEDKIPIRIKFLHGELPPCVEVGNSVRVWGSYSSENPTIFMGTHLRPLRLDAFSGDGTGVRRRLGRESGGCQGSELRPEREGGNIPGRRGFGRGTGRGGCVDCGVGRR